jgi:carbonic anhydrase/acetyltransferase-like protein (isoleucine patch superfamily)
MTALIKSLRGFVPHFGENLYLADNAVIIGNVTIGNDCSIWFNAVLRGDVNAIYIGNRVNIQDGSIIHTLYGESVTEIADDVSIGHNAVIHGAKIESGVLIGIGAVVLDHVLVGEGSLVAAGSIVLSGTKIEKGSIYGGIPAKFIKKIGTKYTNIVNHKIAKNYLMYAKWYKE